MPTEIIPQEPEPETATPEPIQPNIDNFKLDPRYIEKRNRRVQLLLQHSLFEKVFAEAEKEGESINEIITRAIQNYFDGGQGREIMTIPDGSWEMLKIDLELDYTIVTKYEGFTAPAAKAISGVLETMKEMEEKHYELKK